MEWGLIGNIKVLSIHHIEGEVLSWRRGRKQWKMTSENKMPSFHPSRFTVRSSGFNEH